MFGFDDSPVIVVEEAEIASGVGDVVVRRGTRVGWIHIGGGIGHGIFTTVHEDSGIPHGGGSGIGNFHRLGDALALQMAEDVNIGTADEG